MVRETSGLRREDILRLNRAEQRCDPLRRGMAAARENPVREAGTLDSRRTGTRGGGAGSTPRKPVKTRGAER